MIDFKWFSMFIKIIKMLRALLQILYTNIGRHASLALLDWMTILNVHLPERWLCQQSQSFNGANNIPQVPKWCLFWISGWCIWPLKLLWLPPFHSCIVRVPWAAIFWAASDASVSTLDLSSQRQNVRAHMCDWSEILRCQKPSKPSKPSCCANLLDELPRISAALSLKVLVDAICRSAEKMLFGVWAPHLEFIIPGWWLKACFLVTMTTVDADMSRCWLPQRISFPHN